jgi:hypothetical protein
MAQAPEAQERTSLPAGQAAALPQFSAPAAPMYFAPSPAMPLENTRRQDGANPMDFRKQFGVSTPAEIMNLKSPEEIFGIIKKPTDSQKELARRQNFETNSLAPDSTAIIAEPGWAKSWLAGDTGKSGQSSNSTERASGLFSGFFDAARSDNVFGSHNLGDSDTPFGQPQTVARQQSSWDSQLSMGELAPSAPAAQPVASGFTGFGSSSSAGTLQSPFTPPQVSSMDTLPRLPALPSVSRQIEQFTPPSLSPSWGPKSPPWAQAQTPLGTPAPVLQR